MSTTSLPQPKLLDRSLSLHPLSIAETLDGAFRLYRANFRALASAVASVLVTMSILRALYARNQSSPVDWQQISPLRSDVLLSTLALLRLARDPFDLLLLFAGSLLLYLIARVLLTGILVNTTAQSYMGPLGASLPGRTRGLRREIALIPALLLLLPLDLQSALLARGLARAAPFVAALLQGMPEPLTAMLDSLNVTGRGLLVSTLMIFLCARFVLAPQAVMLERLPAFAGLARSWRLTSGRFWWVAVVALATSAIVALLIGLPPALARLLLALSGWRWASGALSGGASLVSQVIEALALPFQVAVFTVLYYDTRIRKEGYDLELLAQRAREAEVQALMDSGLYKLRQNDPRAALLDFEQALRLKPDDAGIIGLCAYAQAALPDLAAALASSERAVARELNPFTLNCRGYVKQASGDLAGALADYRRTVELQPDYPIALAHFADVKYKKADLAGALADFEQILRLTPNDSRALYNAACAYARLGQTDSAIQRLRRAIELKPAWRETAGGDSDFDTLRADPTFMALTEPQQTAVEE
jgi:tetratricopeptide (TPR) repeat protein